jgi:hypothetical protein
MYMQEALELVCRKRKLMNPKDYALLLSDMSILIPLDRTVASLQGKREMVLVKSSMLPQIGGDLVKGTGRTTDPNGGRIFCFIHRPVCSPQNSSIYFQTYVRHTGDSIFLCIGLHCRVQGV